MIVITTPTGQIGTHVVRDLLEIGKPLRVIVRDPARLDQHILDHLEVISGSHGDAATLDRALHGADTLFWVAPPDSTRTVDDVFIEFTRPVVEAIRRHRVKRVVGVTALGRGTPWQDRAGLVTASIRMDDMLMSSGASFRGLAMPSFMDNFSRQVTPMKEKGMFFGPIDPDTKLPWIATRDIAAVATRWLTDDSWSGQTYVPVIGPEDLSHNDIAAIISDVSGRDIRYQQIGWDQFKQGFLARGTSESFAQAYVEMYRAKNEAMDNAAAKDAKSRERTGFREWAERNLKPKLA